MEEKTLKIARKTLLTNKIILIIWVIFVLTILSFKIFDHNKSDYWEVSMIITFLPIAIFVSVLSLVSGISGIVRANKIKLIKDIPGTEPFVSNLKIYSQLVIIPVVLVTLFYISLTK